MMPCRGDNPAMPFYQAYISGKHREVWAELDSLGEQVLEDRFATDARAVMTETMRRVKRNVQTVVGRLRAIHYRFAAEVMAAEFTPAPPAESREASCLPYLPPHPLVAQQLGTAQELAGTMPLSLQGWFEIVGSVNLIGTHAVLSPPDGSVLSDPLVVISLCEIMRELKETVHPPFVVPISPDAQAKAGIASRGLYRVRLPNPGMDARIESLEPSRTFVEYLRNSFEKGGFPGLPGSPAPEVEYLRTGLLAF
jgi:hypothetical protein